MHPGSHSKAGTNRAGEEVGDSVSGECGGLRDHSGVTRWEERAETTE